MSPTPKPLRYRPHHFLCSLGYQGKGYSDGFTENMTAIVMGRLRASGGDGVIIEVIEDRTDDICAPCPMRNADHCTDEAKIAALDARHAEALGLTAGMRLTWGDAKRRMREHLRPTDLDHLCQGCQWLKLGVCQNALAQLRKPEPRQYIRHTPRLRLEPFSPRYLSQLNAMNNEPEVMRYLGGDIPEPLEKTREGITRVQKRWMKHGFGWWVVIEKASDTLIGAACLQHLAHQEDADLEIGWRLLPQHQGKGYATEAGQAAIDYGFHTIGVDLLKAVTLPENIKSQKVMQRLGMRYIGEETHYDQNCTTYEIRKPA